MTLVSQVGRVSYDRTQMGFMGNTQIKYSDDVSVPSWKVNGANNLGKLLNQLIGGAK